MVWISEYTFIALYKDCSRNNPGFMVHKESSIIGRKVHPWGEINPIKCVSTRIRLNTSYGT